MAGAPALRAYAELLGPVMLDLLRAPILPPALYPRPWALPDLRAVLGELGRAYHPVVARHLADRLGNA